MPFFTGALYLIAQLNQRGGGTPTRLFSHRLSRRTPSCGGPPDKKTFGVNGHRQTSTGLYDVLPWREGDTRRLRQYLLRWWWWLLGGLDGIVSRKGGVLRIERLVFYWLDIHPRRGTVTASGA